MATAAEKAQQEQIKASREASSFFQLFDKSTLYNAIPQRETSWLLGETTGEIDTLSTHVPISNFSLPQSENEPYALFIPRETPPNTMPLKQQELNRILWEITVGVYVFNAVPSISFQPNHDCSSSCVIPSAYRDTLVGKALFEVDYFIKSLLHGTTIPQQIQRDEINETWKKIPSNVMRQTYKDMGLLYMQDDAELGYELYESKREPFIRHPPKYVDSDLACSELTPRLTTGEEYNQQTSHISRDVFLRYLDNVNIGLVFTQNTIKQDGILCVLDPMVHIVTRVKSPTTSSDQRSDIHRHLHCYLQKQRDFIADNLRKKREIAHYIDLLSFASFITQFLVSLKQHKKIISFSGQCGDDARLGKAIHTSREVPPVLPSETSRWSPFTSNNSYSSLHGDIEFHIPQLTATTPGPQFMEVYKDISCSGGALTKEKKDLATCEVEDRAYYVLQLNIEDYYPKSPKLPRWVHCMTSELKSQYTRLPSLNPRIQDMLRRLYGSREASNMQTVPVQLLASINKGLLPLVALLLKRCTKTHLSKLDDTGHGLVHYAAANCHTDVISLLLHAGCPVDQSSDVELSKPIHLAAESGGLDAVSCLIHYGADILATDRNGWSPVHHAAFHNYHTIVTHLCTIETKCIDLNTEDNNNSSPLLLATRNGGYDSVRSLIELGADITAKNSSDLGVVQLAALYHHINILKYLVNLARDELPVFELLSDMLMSEAVTGYPEAASRSLDPLTQWRPSEHSTELLKHKAIPSLVELLKQRSDEKVQHYAVQVLANISSDPAIITALVETNAILPLITLLSSSSERVQACSCTVLCDMGTTAPDIQASITQAIPQLVKLLASEADDVQLYSAACLGILAYDSSSNQTSVMASSALPALKKLLFSELSCIQACVSNTIQTIMEDNRGCQLGALSPNLLSPLIQLLRSKEVSVHKAAALAIEAIAENCPEAQQELLGSSTCITHLKRLLRMRDSQVKVAGGRALWAIAGHLISNQRMIATHMGLNLLVSMLTIHNEKLDYVCSEALGSLATELGDNQMKIMDIGGIKPLIEVLTLPTSQRVYLSVINTISKLIVRPALKPNKELQKEVAKSRGIAVLASIVSSEQSTELVRVSAACTLAVLVLESQENMKNLTRNTDFSLHRIFNFLSSQEAIVQIRAGQCLAILAYNNTTQLVNLRQHGVINIDFYQSFLESGDEYFKCCTGFQLVVLSKLLTGISDAEAAVKGIKILVESLRSEVEATQVLAAEFIACLAHSGPGIPETVVMAGALDVLISNLTSGSGPVIENCCVALGYFTFHPMASRLIVGMFRDEPDKMEVFHEYTTTIVISQDFMSRWKYIEREGLPVLSLECRGGPSASEGWRIQQHNNKMSGGVGKTKRMTSLADPSTLTQGTEYKSHSTLQRVSFADVTTSLATTAAAGTVPAALPHNTHKHLTATPTSETAATPSTSKGGLLTMRKTELNKKNKSIKTQYNHTTKTMS